MLAKAALLRGAERAFDILPSDVEALTVDRHGVVHTTPGLTAYTGGVVPPSQLDYSNDPRSNP